MKNKNPRQNRYKELSAPSWLYKQYVKRRRSMSDIAKEIGCFENSVRNALRKFGIPIRRYTVSILAIEARKLGGSSKRKIKKGRKKQ